jgi:putative solute:sodium symporter small subunit
MNTDTSSREEHWRRTKNLMMITLTIWFIFSFVVHWNAGALNAFTFLDFPLGFYMAAQGSEIVFVITLFWFVRAQHNIDRECGFAEEE